MQLLEGETLRELIASRSLDVAMMREPDPKGNPGLQLFRGPDVKALDLNTRL